MLKGIAFSEESKSQPKRDGPSYRKRTFRTPLLAAHTLLPKQESRIIITIIIIIIIITKISIVRIKKLF